MFWLGFHFSNKVFNPPHRLCIADCKKVPLRAAWYHGASLNVTINSGSSAIGSTLYSAFPPRLNQQDKPGRPQIHQAQV